MSNLVLLKQKLRRPPRRPAVKLTKATIAAAPVETVRYWLADSEQKGLYLRVAPGGHKSLWVRAMVNRAQGSVRREVKIADALGADLNAVRALAQATVGSFDRGEDPRLARFNRFTVLDAIEAHDRDMERREIVKRREVTSALSRGFHGYKDQQLADLRRADILQLMSGMTPGAADWFRKCVATLLANSVSSGKIEFSVLAGYRKPEASRAERIARTAKLVSHENELRRVWTALAAAGDPVFVDLCRLTLLLGLRRAEAANITSADVQGDILLVPGSRRKTGEDHTALLGQLSMEILRRRNGEGLVFPGRNGRVISGWTQRLAPVVAALPGFRMHSLRRTYRSGLSMLGVRTEIAELMVGHAQPGLIRIYNRAQLLDERRAAQNIWEEYVAAEISA